MRHDSDAIWKAPPVGVPPINPLAGPRARPGGKAPDVMDHARTIDCCAFVVSCWL